VGALAPTLRGPACQSILAKIHLALDSVTRDSPLEPVCEAAAFVSLRIAEAHAIPVNPPGDLAQRRFAVMLSAKIRRILFDEEFVLGAAVRKVDMEISPPRDVTRVPARITARLGWIRQQ
jgi:hypothetical protein